MEANQITCPQCGLANNALADACIQCGIIFMKKSAKETPAAPDHQQRKALEAAEAKPNETRKPPELDAFTNEIIKRPDPHQDTVEMPIPKESPVVKKSEASAPEKTEPEADKNSGNYEIEMEAIEAAMESVSETVDAEALFLSEVNPDLPAQAAAPAKDPKQAGPLSESEKADDPRDEIAKPDADKAGSQDTKVEAQPQKQPAGSSMAGSQKQENLMEKENGKAQAEAAEPAKTEKTVTEVAAAPKAEDHAITGAMAQPPEKEIKPDEKPTATVAETKMIANATLEMPKELTEEKSRENLLAEKAKQEALKKQQEAQMKAEALEKQKAAKAEALKKKKLAQARAEALRNQRVAEIKAEALKKKKEAQARAQATEKQEAARARADVLKKQKEAQAKAEASSREMQLARNGMPQAAASKSHHERLLALLKRYKGKAIGINYDNSSEIREAELVDANEEFFSVTVKDKKLQYSYPLKTILTIVEGQEGVEAGEGDKKAKFDAVIKVYTLVPF